MRDERRALIVLAGLALETYAQLLSQPPGDEDADPRSGPVRAERGQPLEIELAQNIPAVGASALELDPRAGLRGPNTNAHTATLGEGEAELGEEQEEPPQASGVGLDDSMGRDAVTTRFEPQRDPALPRARLELGEDGTDEFDHVDGLGDHVNSPALEFGELEQVIDHVPELLDRPAGPLQCPMLLLVQRAERAHGEQVRVAEDRVQRRAQLVAGAGEEAPPHTARSLELGPQPRDRRATIFDFTDQRVKKFAGVPS